MSEISSCFVHVKSSSASSSHSEKETSLEPFSSTRGTAIRVETDSSRVLTPIPPQRQQALLLKPVCRRTPLRQSLQREGPPRVLSSAKVTAVPIALGMMSGIVFAATKDKSNVTVVNIDELSLYTTPKQKLLFVKTENGQLEQGVATIRQTVEPYATWCQGTYEKVKPKVESIIQFGTDSYAYLKNPPPEFYPRAGIIGFTGFLGIFLARGSRVKRLIYPTGLMAISTSLYYPQPAATIAKSTGDYVYDLALQGYVAMENVFKPASKLAVEKSVNEEGLASETKPE
ncbi:apolipoprotein O, a isoform X2 [Osmerus eperlanus]|uniref:apolipoprotein O, a isoform X2 n=1 Tax=Osmerus eperlanus TaxID=29151 RepID=UPI002E0EC68A